MSTATGTLPDAAKATLPRTRRDLAVGALPLLAVSAASCWLLALPTSHVLETSGLYAGLALLILRLFPEADAGPGIGHANRVTLLRATLVLPVVALTMRPGPFLDQGYWWIIGVSTLAMVLDGVDGVVARRTRTESAFGARFDMEVDALLLLALSWLLWESGKAGPWVLLIGALRYLFVLAGRPWPALRGELPPSLRRKVVCVVQGVALLVCLGPIIPGLIASLVAAAALLLLVYSFAVDAWWLVRPDAPDRASTVELR